MIIVKDAQLLLSDRQYLLLEWLTPHDLEHVQMSLKTQIVSLFVICTLKRRTYHLQNRLHLLLCRIPGTLDIPGFIIKVPK